MKTILKDATTYQKRIIYNFFVSFLKARKNNFSLESMHELRDAIYRLYRNLYKDTRILNTKTKIKETSVDSNAAGFSTWNDIDWNKMNTGYTAHFYLKTPSGNILLETAHPYF